MSVCAGGVGDEAERGEVAVCSLACCSLMHLSVSPLYRMQPMVGALKDTTSIAAPGLLEQRGGGEGQWAGLGLKEEIFHWPLTGSLGSPQNALRG